MNDARRCRACSFARDARRTENEQGGVDMLQIEMWQLITAIAAIVVTFATMIWAFGKILAKQFKESLDARFATQDELRKQRELAMDARFKRMEEDLEGKAPHYNERISYLEANAKKSPTHDDLSEIHEKINGVSKEISKLTGEFSGVHNLLQTVHEYLLNGGKK
jgi:flagellar biosynthesis/type III secretory pathway M-ring protein FliF/YscJ